MGLFGRKKKPDIEFRSVSRPERDGYFNMLRQQGWGEMENPFEFDKNWDVEKIRKAAKSYAGKAGADLLVEVSDPSFSSNPYNDLVYYIFKHAGGGQPPATDTHVGQYPGNRQGAYPQGSGQYPQGRVAQQPQSFQGGPPSQSPPRQPGQSGGESNGQELFLKSYYESFEDAFVDSLSNISKMLCMEPCPLPFTDNREYMGRSVFLGKASYDHMGVRMMDLILVNPETNVYKIMGNEGHDPRARRVQYMRDDLVLIKTEGLPRFDILQDYKKLNDQQKSDIAKALYSFLEHYLPKR